MKLNKNGWQVKSLSEVAEIVTGGTPSTAIKEYWENGNVPWLNSGELNQGIVTSSSNYITQLGLKNSVAKLLPPDTILIALTGATTGRVGYLTFEACANQSVTGILPSANHDPKFLYYFLQTLRVNILKIAWGGAQKHINQKFVKELKIPLPPLPIQKQIAEILEKADEAKQKRKEANKLTDEFLQSVFIEMFGDPVKNPKGWERKKILDLISKIENENPLSFPAKEYDYIDISSIDNVLKTIIEIKKINGKNAPSRARQLVKCNDVLVSTVRPNLNAVTIVKENFSNPIASTGFCILRANSKFVVPEYLFQITKQSFFIEILSQMAKGASYPAVTDVQIIEIEISVPPLSLQQQFAELVNKTEALKEKQKQSELELENLFQSLMQRAFKGELVLN